MFLFVGSISATGIWNPFARKNKKEISNFSFHIQSSSGNYTNVDSALIVLDKYNLTGARVVIKVVTADHNNRLNLTDVPVGKYFAGIYTYGLRKQYIPIVITVSGKQTKRKTNTARVVVADTDSYVMGKATIPPENTHLFIYTKHYK